MGKAKVTIPKMASHEDLQAELIKKFPKLKDAGGFEVLRALGSGGGQRELILIRPGAFRYTAPYLKDRMGQAIAYIRPLQRNLSDKKQVIQVTSVTVILKRKFVAATQSIHIVK